MEKQDKTIIETTVFLRSQVLPFHETIKTYNSNEDILMEELKSIQNALTGEAYLVEIDPSTKPIQVRLYHPDTLKNVGYGTIRTITYEKPEHDPNHEQMFYFTFGTGHAHSQGYVKIFGTFTSSRDEMTRRHGDDWNFQYTSITTAGINKHNLYEVK